MLGKHRGPGLGSAAGTPSGKCSLQVAHAGGGCRGPMWQEQLAEKVLEGQLRAQEVSKTVPPFQQGQRLPMMIGLNIFNLASRV